MIGHFPTERDIPYLILAAIPVCKEGHIAKSGQIGLAAAAGLAINQ
jgi:hypothetical protein